MENPAAKRLMSLERYLYGRIMYDLDNRENIEQELKGEWEKDRLVSIGYRIEDFIRNEVLKRIWDGSFPKTNLDFDAEKQWDHVWQDRLITRI